MKLSKLQEEFIRQLKEERWPRTNECLAKTTGERSILGVACEALMASGTPMVIKQGILGRLTFNRVETTMPFKLISEYKFYNSRGRFTKSKNAIVEIEYKGKKYNSITALDNDMDLSFSEIGQIIEDNKEIIFNNDGGFQAKS